MLCPELVRAILLPFTKLGGSPTKFPPEDRRVSAKIVGDDGESTAFLITTLGALTVNNLKTLGLALFRKFTLNVCGVYCSSVLKSLMDRSRSAPILASWSFMGTSLPLRARDGHEVLGAFLALARHKGLMVATKPAMAGAG